MPVGESVEKLASGGGGQGVRAAEGGAGAVASFEVVAQGAQDLPVDAQRAAAVPNLPELVPDGRPEAGPVERAML